MIRPASLTLTLALALTLTLAPTWFRLRPLNSIARRQAYLEFDDLVPQGIRALVVGNRQKLSQTSTRILWLRFVAYRWRRRLLVGRDIGCRLLVGRVLERGCFSGILFIHLHIIARIMVFVPALLVVPNALWDFRYVRCLLRR